MDNYILRWFSILLLTSELRNVYVNKFVFGVSLSDLTSSGFTFEQKVKRHSEDILYNRQNPQFSSGGKNINGEKVKVVIPQFSLKRGRKRRDINFRNFIQETYVRLLHLDDLVLELQDDRSLVIPPTSVWIYRNFSTEKPFSNCSFTRGKINRYFEKSLALLTLCGIKVMGIISTSTKKFFIEPLNDIRNSHAIHERNLLHTKHDRSKRHKRQSLGDSLPRWEYFNLTGDTLDVTGETEDFGLDEYLKKIDYYNEFNMYDHQKDESQIFMVEVENNGLSLDDGDLGYFLDSAWNIDSNRHHTISAPNLPQHWLEIALAVDHTVISFHGKEKVEHYVLSLMNIVNAIFQDPSLEANMQLIITKLLFYENKKLGVIKPGNAKKSLENVNSWNRRLHVTLAPGEPSHDVAIWLTRDDIGGPSGYAPVGGVCDSKRSCALNKDEGLSSAFIIAHEVGHMLGLSHDGDIKLKNSCGDEAQDGSVMAPMVAANFHKFVWSHCSRDEFKNKIDKWFCIKNPPTGLGEILLNNTIHTSFTMDEQCRMEFGDRYELCRTFDVSEPCSHLWCSHQSTPLVCKTKKGPPLEGTNCGSNKWCVDGYCQDIDPLIFGMQPVAHNPQDGAWGSWSEWGLCSRNCGTGVQFRTRKCDSPPPSYGGSDCMGSSEEWRLCNTEKCPEPGIDIRAQQCHRLPQLLNLKDGKAHVIWLPHESDDERLKCQLICQNSETRELFVTGENLLDGTPCSYDSSSNICIQGVCQRIGCDGKLFSKLKEDACGICGGDNRECKEIKKNHQKRIKRELSRLAIIPRMSREISIQTNLTTHAALNLSVAFIIKDRLKRKFLIPIPNNNVYKEIIQGTRFIYKKQGNTHDLTARGPILAEIIVMLHISKTNVEIGVNASYSTQFFINKILLEDTGRFGWILGGWGPCSASCGGGHRQRTSACWDRLHARIVPKRRCSLAFKPIQPKEDCNTFSCNFQWIPGPWEPCSSTCGSNGIQFRELYCVHKSIWTEALRQENKTVLQNPWHFMVTPDKCAGQKPEISRPCYRIPCPSYWEFEEWSECSTTCGPGLSTRQAWCLPPSEDETFYTCGTKPPIQSRVCTSPVTKNKHICHKKKCFGDKSKSCKIGVLHYYCQIGAFRKLCCETCKQHRKLAPVSS